MKTVKNLLWSLYLGGALGIFGHMTVFDWQWWAIFAPTAILVVFLTDHKATP